MPSVRDRTHALVEPPRRQVAALIGEATCNPVVKFLIQLLFSEACTG
jgi:hypothetical protein